MMKHWETRMRGRRARHRNRAWTAAVRRFGWQAGEQSVREGSPHHLEFDIRAIHVGSSRVAAEMVQLCALLQKKGWIENISWIANQSGCNSLAEERHLTCQKLFT